MEYAVEEYGHYWTTNNELRACIVTIAAGDVRIIDKETLEPLDVPLEHVMIERTDD